MELKFGFGAALPDNVMGEDLDAMWGARAIWRERTAYFDMLPDRQQFSGDDAVKQGLLAWVNKVGLPLAREWAKRIRGSSSDVFLFEEGPYGIRATPNSSHGYMYLRAWHLRQGEKSDAKT